MRVTAVTAWFPSEKATTSGAFIVKDCHAIAQAGVDIQLVHLVNPQLDDGRREFEYEGIKVRRIPFNAYSPLDVRRVSRLLPSLVGDSEVIHTMAMSSLAPVVFAKLRHIPWVHTEHWSGVNYPETLSFRERMARPLVFHLEKQPDVVVSVVGPFLSDPIRRAGRKKPTVEIPCIVPPAPHLAERRKPVPPFRLVSVGGMIPRKDPMFALRVVSELNRRGQTSSLTWVGAGLLRTEMEDYAREHKIELHLTGSLPPSGVSAQLSEADMFIGPTHGENFFVSCAEAIVQGRPVVVSACGGHRYYIRDYVGEVMARHDVGAYADAVEKVLGNYPHPSASEIAASVGDAFSPEVVGKSYRLVYESLSSQNLAALEDLPPWRGW